MANTKSLDLELSSSQYASIADGSQTGLDITGNISIEAWIKIEQLPSTAGSSFYIISKEQVNDRSYGLKLSGSNDKLVMYYFSDVSDFTRYNSDDSFVDADDVGTWIHIAISVNVSAKTVQMYKNGSPINSTSDSLLSISILDTSSKFSIGESYGGDYFDGLIDEVRVWNDIRTGTEISDNYEKELVGDEAGLVGYWQFNDDYLDQTSNDNDLTASGSPTFSSDVPFTGSLTLVVDTMALSLTFSDIVLKKAITLATDTMALLLDFKDVILKSTSWTNDTKPSDSWTNDTKPSDSWTNDSK